MFSASTACSQARKVASPLQFDFIRPPVCISAIAPWRVLVMMAAMWLLFAFSGPVLWAASMHIDKYLVDKYFQKTSTAVLMVFNSVVDLLALPVIWYFIPEVFAVSPFAIAVMTASGALYVIAMLFYLQAIQS